MREPEARLWALIHAVESSTVARYDAAAPELLTDDRRASVRAMADALPPGTSIAGSALDDALRDLLAATAGDGSLRDALLLQGVVLEHLGVTLYRAFGDGGRLSEEGGAIAARAGAASADAGLRAAAALRALEPDPAARFDAFAARTHGAFACLAELGDAMDAAFAGPFGLEFADVMGDFVAELLPVCVDELGFARRKVVVHLTSALMG